MSSSLVFALLRHGQKFLVYPSAFIEGPREISKPSELGLEYEDLALTTADGVRLDCYFISHAAQSAQRIQEHEDNDFPRDSSSAFRPPESYEGPAIANVLMFHGNGMNYGDLMYAAKRLVMRRCNVLLLSYRGYGTSKGSPSESGLKLDAQAALDRVRKGPALPTILFGTSLGGAVAIDLASRNPTAISAIILENTFLSLPRVVRDWPYIGLFSFLVMQRWNSASRLPSIPATVPMLFLSGASDEVVPKKHMEGLWEIARRRKRGATSGLDRFESFKAGMHADTFLQPGYWDKVDDWLQAVTAPPES
ncbi:Hydrolase-4 domain-containing protein [Mycena indigotica]|uniref:Hydrolase-4 domain-containing protein n=1 Tax=Mycena indigotica TaxID=2126181 RepID=A0A8H6TBG0_9AGAR|nr:Hydrolase-4 domain-containing protein [Mycena indigotica]KAF7312775.1 Hydrolase-4 domain-containing protein [Mycena indigotica]